MCGMSRRWQLLHHAPHHITRPQPHLVSGRRRRRRRAGWQGRRERQRWRRGTRRRRRRGGGRREWRRRSTVLAHADLRSARVGRSNALSSKWGWGPACLANAVCPKPRRRCHPPPPQQHCPTHHISCVHGPDSSLFQGHILESTVTAGNEHASRDGLQADRSCQDCTRKAACPPACLPRGESVRSRRAQHGAAWRSMAPPDAPALGHQVDQLLADTGGQHVLADGGIAVCAQIGAGVLHGWRGRETARQCGEILRDQLAAHTVFFSGSEQQPLAAAGRTWQKAWAAPGSALQAASSGGQV